METLSSAVRSDRVRESLATVASDSAAPKALRLLAEFGGALGKGILRPGKRPSARQIAEEVIVLARTLGTILDSQNLATLGLMERREVYLKAINQAADRRSSRCRAGDSRH